MKFLYEYRTSDNTKHDGVVSAADKDAAYALLKQRNIRPSRLSEAPGFFNKLFGKGKRWLAIAVLGAACVVLAVIIHTNPTPPTPSPTPTALPRHQIANIPPDWTQYVDSIFTNALDRLLARHSQPGVIVAADATSRLVPPDAPWVDTLRNVVEGMKGDAVGFLQLGRTVNELERFLGERQRMEASYRERTIMQVRSGEIGRAEANEILKAMELAPVE